MRNRNGRVLNGPSVEQNERGKTVSFIQIGLYKSRRYFVYIWIIGGVQNQNDLCLVNSQHSSEAQSPSLSHTEHFIYIQLYGAFQ